MFVGACAGSTGGGIKVSRFVILLKTVRKELHQFLHPNSIKKIKMDGKALEHEVVRNTNVFLITYVMIFDMLAGRLEIFPLLLLFVRDTWKRF